MIPVEEVNKIIRTYARDDDAFQDAWVEILDKRAQNEEEITRIAKNYRWGFLRIGNDVRGDRTLREGSSTTLFDILIGQPIIPIGDDGATEEHIDNLMRIQQRQIKGGSRGNHHIDKNKDTRSLFHMKAPQKDFELAQKLGQEGMPIHRIVDYLLNKTGHKYSTSTIHVWLRNPDKLVDPYFIMNIDKIPQEEHKPTISRPRTDEEKVKISISVRRWYRLHQNKKQSVKSGGN